MNREIRFKAKRKDNGEWVEGYYRAEPDLDKQGIVGGVMDTQKAIEYFSGKLERTLSNRRRKAYEAALEALEKQEAKKVEIKEWSPAICPSCGYELSESVGDGYYKHPTFLERCPNPDCGQKIKWEE